MELIYGLAIPLAITIAAPLLLLLMKLFSNVTINRKPKIKG